MLLKKLFPVPARIDEVLKKGQLLFEPTHIHKDGTRINVEVNAKGYSKELGYSINALKVIFSKFELPAETYEKIKTITENDIPTSQQYIESSVAKMELLLQGLLRFSREKGSRFYITLPGI